MLYIVTLFLVEFYLTNSKLFFICFSYFSAHYHISFHVFLLVEHIFCFQYPQVILHDRSMVVKFLSPFVHKSPLILPLNLVIVWLSSETIKKNILLELQEYCSTLLITWEIKREVWQQSEYCFFKTVLCFTFQKLLGPVWSCLEFRNFRMYLTEVLIYLTYMQTFYWISL